MKYVWWKIDLLLGIDIISDESAYIGTVQICMKVMNDSINYKAYSLGLVYSGVVASF